MAHYFLFFFLALTSNVDKNQVQASESDELQADEFFEFTIKAKTISKQEDVVSEEELRQICRENGFTHVNFESMRREEPLSYDLQGNEIVSNWIVTYRCGRLIK